MPIRQIPTPYDLPDPSLIPEAPAAVVDAAKLARERGDTLEAAKAELQEAEAAIAQADAADQAADREALATGDKLPGPKAGPKAREAVAAANRKLEAAEANFREAAAELVAAIRAHKDEWTATIEQLRQEAVQAVFAALDVYRGASLRISDLDQTAASIRGLDHKPSDPWSSGGFKHSARQRRRRVGDPSLDREEFDKHLRLRRRLDNEHEVGKLLVELEYLATGERPWKDAPETSRALAKAKTGEADFRDSDTLAFLLEYATQGAV